MEMANKDMSHKQVRDGMVAYIERRRGTSASGSIPKDTGNPEEDEFAHYAPDPLGVEESPETPDQARRASAWRPTHREEAMPTHGKRSRRAR